VFNHPFINAEMIKKCGESVSSQVLQIIELHHELPNDQGFPRGVDSRNIPLLAGLVIIADVYTTKILEPEYKAENAKELLEYLDTHFSKGIFRTAKDALFLATNKK
ncbi:MAG: HD domain-containing phosphohydrolase, partial [Bacteroidota bacterium]